nr:flagellar hook-associated protein FlgK [uncultured Roseateles sp.]
MGTSALISLGTRAMFANYAALQAVGQNIANANTPGYSRQTVELSNSTGQYTGAGFFGKGVDVTTVTRSHDEFLTREAATSRAVSAMDATRSSKLSQLEKVFGTGADGLGYAASQLLNSMVDVSTHPADPSARQSALARAQEAASRFSDAGKQLDALQDGVAMDMRTTVATVNQLAKQIVEANNKIAAVQGGGHTPNDLLDQRDHLISELSEHVQVSTMIATDGTMGVFIGGGQRLVLGGSAQELTVLQNEYDPARVQLGIIEANGTRMLDENTLGGGSIAGILQYQNVDLQQARNLVGQLAVSFSSEINKQQALGLDMTSAAGSPGAALFSVGPPLALPAATNARDPGGAFTSRVNLSITDANQLKASSYELVADPAGTPGSYQLTRLSDGNKQLVADGDTVDGFKISFGAVPPGATDRFLLQPVTRAANDMQRIMDKPSGLAAASPVTGTVGANNKGTGTIAAVSAVLPSTDPSVIPDIKVNITFTSDTGDYSYDFVDRASGGVVSSGVGTWQPGQAIELNGFQLKLNGVPKGPTGGSTGDTFTVDKTALPATSNGNALAFLALRDKQMVGKQLQPDGSITGGATLTDAYASAMSDIGVRVQGAATKANISGSVAATAEQERSSKAGVNLDEEAARLMQFQQSYQAAAKVLQVAQSVFDTLLQVASK